jgi:hypothetical protein
MIILLEEQSPPVFNAPRSLGANELLDGVNVSTFTCHSLQGLFDSSFLLNFFEVPGYVLY